VARMMGSPDGRLVELFGAVKSWMPRRGDHSPPPPASQSQSAAAAAGQPLPHDLSRDFWMPDQSCRVCYDCDAQFTILNRRHHCRHCGRVFCARCTANSVPRSPGDAAREDGERIRVCNYCYKRWLEEDAAARGDDYPPLALVVTSPASLGRTGKCRPMRILATPILRRCRSTERATAARMTAIPRSSSLLWTLLQPLSLQLTLTSRPIDSTFACRGKTFP